MNKQYTIYIVSTYNDGPEEAFLTKESAEDYIKSTCLFYSGVSPEDYEVEYYISSITLTEK